MSNAFEGRAQCAGCHAAMRQWACLTAVWEAYRCCVSLGHCCPGENFIYYGDSANAPYGEKRADEIRELAWGVVERLLARDIKALRDSEQYGHGSRGGR